MYRVFLFIAFLAYCSSVPFSGLNSQKSATFSNTDETDLVDNTGAGYSYFKKQQVDARPSFQPATPIPTHDLSAYMHSSALTAPSQQTQVDTANKDLLVNSAYAQQQVNSRVPNTYGTNQVQQPVLLPQNDLSQLRPTISSGYGAQQPNLLAKNLFGNQQQYDLRTLGSPQILLPQTSLNMPQKTLSSYGNGQKDLTFLQPQQTWSAQQKSGGYSSSYNGQGQQPISSSFLTQSNQQNDMPSVTNSVFMSSQVPTQRFNSQVQPIQPASNTGTPRGW